jgi:hypothetical protein
MTRKSRAPAPVLDRSDANWHLDRKVPVALMMTMFLMFAGQSATALWWASKMDSRVENLEKQNASAAPMPDRLTRVEVKLEAVQSGITEIKDILRVPAKPR